MNEGSRPWTELSHQGGLLAWLSGNVRSQGWAYVRSQRDTYPWNSLQEAPNFSRKCLSPAQDRIYPVYWLRQTKTFDSSQNTVRDSSKLKGENKRIDIKKREISKFYLFQKARSPPPFPSSEQLLAAADWEVTPIVVFLREHQQCLISEDRKVISNTVTAACKVNFSPEMTTNKWNQ